MIGIRNDLMFGLILQQPSGCFQMPKTMYNHTRGLSQSKPDNCIRPGLEHLNVCPADVIFLDPDN